MDRRLLYLITLLLYTACTSPEGDGRSFFVQLQLPETFKDIPLEGMEIKLINTNKGTVYNSPANTSGLAVFNVEYGIYRLSSQLKYHNNYVNYLFNAAAENLLLTPTGGYGNDTLILPLNYSPLSLLIIKEIYYAGCRNENDKPYLKDGFISLYNNSEETVWLDGLCLGITAPLNATKTSNWLLKSDTLIPIIWTGWQFPGNGQDNPLAPGETTTIAMNAVDHTKINKNSIDLSGVDWAFYHPSLSNHDIATGVTPLNLFWKYGSTSGIVFSINGPGIVLYYIPGISAAEYATAHLCTEPNSANSMEYLVIHRDWVVDGIDCVADATKQGFKRLPPILDVEPVFMPSGNYSKRSLHRKKAGERNGHIIYQDSNNSANDFEEREIRLPVL